MMSHLIFSTVEILISKLECQQSRDSRRLVTQTNRHTHQMHTRAISIEKQRFGHENAYVEVVRYGK